jgi:hypothetical protein
MRVRNSTSRSIKLTQVEFDAVISAVEFERRALLAVGDQPAADESLVLLAILRFEWGGSSAEAVGSQLMQRRSPDGC